MRKLLIIFLSLSVFTACSDDDSERTENDPILGVWFLADIQNAEGFGLNENECNKQSSLDFKADGTAAAEFFSESDDNCTPESNNVSWSNMGDSRYRIELPFQGLGAQPGKVVFNGNTSFTFYPDIFSDSEASIRFERR